MIALDSTFAGPTPVNQAKSKYHDSHCRSRFLVTRQPREVEQDRTGLRPTAEMVEITACRLLLVNLLGPLAKGQAITSEVFDGIVEMVKRQKARVATDRLKDYEARR